METLKLEQTQEEESKVIPFNLVKSQAEMIPFIIEQFHKHYPDIIYDKVFYVYSKDKGYWEEAEDFAITKDIQSFCSYYNIGGSFYKHHKTAKSLCEQAKLDFYINIKTVTNLLNFQNGTLEIDNDNFREHRQSDYLFNSLPYEYNAEAKCPKFETFLKEILPDEGVRKVCQETIAYPITRLHLERTAFYIGNGRNGKSTLIEVVTNILGKENVSNISLEDISKNDGKGMNQMKGKLINMTYESDFKILGSASFKSYTSNEPMKVKMLYCDEYQTTDYPQSIVACNAMPQSNDYSEGFNRRILPIPFSVTIQNENVNPNLKEELCEEASGILNWIIEGMKRLRENKKFSISPIIEAFKDELKSESNNVYCYLKENDYVPSHNEKMLLADLYKEIDRYFVEFGYNSIGIRTLKVRLEGLGYKVQRSTGNKNYVWIEKQKKKEEVLIEQNTISELSIENYEQEDLFEDNNDSPF